MGDSAVDFLQETLDDLTLSSKVESNIKGKRQLESLEEEIKNVRGFIKEAEKKGNERIEVMILVREIEDAIAKAESINQELSDFQASKANNAPYPELLYHDLEIVKKEIKTLTAEVRQIFHEIDVNGVAGKKLENSSYKIEGIGCSNALPIMNVEPPVYFSTGGSSISSESNTSKGTEEKVVIGFKEEVNKLLGMLNGSRRFEIVSIVGAVGGGKTTLAREVYEHPFIQAFFEIRFWVNISPDYSKAMKRNLLLRILELAAPEKHRDYENIDEDNLGETTFKCLRGKKYLIVMDNIWSIKAWNDIERSLPKESNGSKVLFTSQLPVEPYGVPCILHCLAPLSESCSWELLEKKAFGNERCPRRLVGTGKLLVGKCGGLPLAIVKLAGILAAKDKTLDFWKDVCNRLSSILAENQNSCMDVIEVGYNQLPPHLKACLVYIGGFPEGSEILEHELIRLWIAEGLVQQSGGDKKLEDLAKDYLSSLIGRNLVLVARKRSFGGIKAYRIHFLLRELCLKKAKADDFLVQIYGTNPISPSAAIKHRRLFIDSMLFREFSSRPCPRNLRSFLCLRLQNSTDSCFESNMSFFIENFELLKVLCFISAGCRGKIGRGDLFHLRYLAIQVPDDIPDSVSPFPYLYNLETLYLQARWNWQSILLPPDVFKMLKLRHLHTKRGVFEYHVSCHYPNVAAGVGFYPSSKLDKLQTLHSICPCEKCQNFLARTPNLRKLGFYGLLISNDFVLMLPDLEFLECLETLSFFHSGILDQATSLSQGVKFPPHVTQLTLKNTGLNWKELSILKTLPSLEVLKLLSSACLGTKWNASELEDGFSQLKYLRLQNLEIEEWDGSEDLFSKLEILVVRGCKYLEQIPIDFAKLNELREIEVTMSSPFAEDSAWAIKADRIETRGDDNPLNVLTAHNKYP